jgi:hypothetical protein
MTKSGEWWSDNPDGDFYRNFVAEPEVRLPAGEWDISATASFHEGGCRGPDRQLRATIRITVEP